MFMCALVADLITAKREILPVLPVFPAITFLQIVTFLQTEHITTFPLLSLVERDQLTIIPKRILFIS
jgi:hypothetical protein